MIGVEDKVCGRIQKAGSSRAKVHKLYEEAQKEISEEINERNQDSMKDHIKRLNENINMWVAVYKETHGRIRSKMS
ncbi:hypothetical protein ACS0TY_033313 [Phlomoides rotata]